MAIGREGANVLSSIRWSNVESSSGGDCIVLDDEDSTYGLSPDKTLLLLRNPTLRLGYVHAQTEFVGHCVYNLTKLEVILSTLLDNCSTCGTAHSVSRVRNKATAKSDRASQRPRQAKHT